ncbi:MAG: class I SAM-dependent methyltransferase [Deltaproteobacteria bacterium]
MKEINNDAKMKARDTYNSAADHFDDLPLAFWNRYGRKTVERLSLARGAEVLDVACGTGASAIPAAEIVGANGKVTGIDLAENLLELVRSKAREKNLSNINFLNADMESSGFPDGSFDAVICVFGIFFVPDMEKQIGELWRIVKPGGKLAITTWGTGFFAPAYDYWKQVVKKERPELYTAYNPWDRITDTDSVRKLMEDGGASYIEVTSEDGQQSLRNPEDWWIIALGSGLRWTIDQLSEDEARRVRKANIKWLTENNINAVGTNVIYAVAKKDETQKPRRD